MELSTDINKVKSGSTFYYAIRVLPFNIQNPIKLLYSLYHQISSVKKQTSDIGIARTKLFWWKEEISRSYIKQARHPLTKEITKIITKYSISKEDLLTFCNIEDSFLDKGYIEERKELFNYIENKQYLLNKLFLNIMLNSKQSNKKQDEFIKSFSYGISLTRFIQNLGLDLRKEHQFLPIDNLENLKQEELSNQMSKYTEQTKEYLNQSKELCTKENLYSKANIKFYKSQINICLKLLKEIEIENYQVMHQKIALTPINKLIISLFSY